MCQDTACDSDLRRLKFTRFHAAHPLNQQPGKIGKVASTLRKNLLPYRIACGCTTNDLRCEFRRIMHWMLRIRKLDQRVYRGQIKELPRRLQQLGGSLRIARQKAAPQTFEADKVARTLVGEIRAPAAGCHDLAICSACSYIGACPGEHQHATATVKDRVKRDLYIAHDDELAANSP